VLLLRLTLRFDPQTQKSPPDHTPLPYGETVVRGASSSGGLESASFSLAVTKAMAAMAAAATAAGGKEAVARVVVARAGGDGGALHKPW